jgi:superfamily II DNA/RNA helicase
LKTFADLGVPARLSANLADRGIITPFPIQHDSIPAALEGRDVCGKAPTGSGKTLAFGLPLVARVEKARPKFPRALVLAPTRELAAQIDKELKPLLALTGRRSVSVYGGVGMEPQIRAFRKGVDVVVACPGRLKDLVDRGAVRLAEVDFVVIDEADRMADMGFLPEVRRLLDQVRDNRQTLLFSATLDGEVDVLVKRYQSNPVRCEVAVHEDDSARTDHRFVETDHQGRLGVTADLIREHGSTAVFCRTKHGADRLALQLGKSGVSATAIHGNRSQAQRDRALEAFRMGRVQALVATDVAARGIHVDGVNCVVHFDPPADAKDYVHRSGRTGRAGAEGVVVSLVTSTTADQVHKLRRDLGHSPEETGPAPQGRPGRKPAGRGGPRRSSGQPRQGPAARQGAPARQGGPARQGAPARARRSNHPGGRPANRSGRTRSAN